jgi:hypothetical protein
MGITSGGTGGQLEDRSPCTPTCTSSPVFGKNPMRGGHPVLAQAAGQSVVVTRGDAVPASSGLYDVVSSDESRDRSRAASSDRRTFRMKRPRLASLPMAPDPERSPQEMSWPIGSSCVAIVRCDTAPWLAPAPNGSVEATRALCVAAGLRSTWNRQRPGSRSTQQATRAASSRSCPAGTSRRSSTRARSSASTQFAATVKPRDS